MNVQFMMKNVDLDSLELTFLDSLKMDGWNSSFPFGKSYFDG